MKQQYKHIHPLVWLFFIITIQLSGCTEKETYIEEQQYASLKIQHIGDLKSAQITIHIEPNAITDSYSYMIGQDEDLDAFREGTHQAIYKVRSNLPQEHTFTYLKPKTTYTLFAQAKDKTGNLGAISTLKITTASSDFTIEQGNTGVRSAAVNIYCSSEYYAYEYAIGSSQDRDSFIDGTLSNINRQEERSDYTAYFFDLEPETDYVVYAKAYDRNNRQSQIYETHLKTKSNKMYPTVSSGYFKIKNLYYGDCYFSINTLAHKASVIINSRDHFDQLLQKEGQGNLMQYLHNLSESREVDDMRRGPFIRGIALTPELFSLEEPFNIWYDAYILLYDLNRKPFAVERLSYKTPPYNPNLPKAQVDITLGASTANGRTFNIHTKNAIGVLVGFYDAQTFEKEMADGTLNDEDVKYRLRSSFSYAPNDMVVSKTIDGLPKGYSIYIMAAAVNANGLKYGTGDIVYKKVTI